MMRLVQIPETGPPDTSVNSHIKPPTYQFRLGGYAFSRLPRTFFHAAALKAEAAYNFDPRLKQLTQSIHLFETGLY